MERIVANQMDEIVISDVLDDDEHEVREVNAKFLQNSSFKGIKRSFLIFNKTQLLQSCQSFKTKQGNKHRINLKFIRLKPERQRQYAWRSLVVFVLGLGVCAALAGTWYYTDLKSDYLLAAAVLAAVATAIALLIFFYRSRDTLVYRSIAAGVPMIELAYRKPNQREFDDFLHKLDVSIRRAHASGMNNQQILAGELKDIRRLKDEGVLGDEVYARARKLIFQHKDFSTV